MNMEEIILGLHPLEIAILPHLKFNDDFDKLVEASKLKDIEVMRALSWLSTKGVLNVDETATEIIELDENGLKYVKDGLPEIRFLNALEGEMDVDTLVKRAKLEMGELNICIGTLKKQVAITVTKDASGKMIFSLTSHGENLKKKDSPLDSFLKKSFPIKLNDLQDLDLFSCQELLKRKQILKKDVIKTRSISITDVGKELLKTDIKKMNLVDSLTPEMIKQGDLNDLKFRRFDVVSGVPTINRGKRHFVNQAINYIKKIWLEMGFEEMTGDYVHTSFWDLDALFMPQDHPARNMQDTFYLKDYKTGKQILSGDLPEFFKDVKDVHENGADTGSTGWQMDWSEDEAKEVMLRTHTTVLSAQKIKELNQGDLPKKFFSVGKVFRNEAMDWSHLFEFHQVEGIVIDENVTFRHLIGFLKEFLGKMGFDKIRIRPHHFPYTEPSVEVDVWNKEREKWVEVLGAGVFRPEVSKTLFGVEVPVLAWGMGMERMISEYFNITDIRDLYRNDLKQLRTMKEFMK